MLALVGWWTGRLSLAGDLWGTQIPMALSTALSFLLCGGALLVKLHWPSSPFGRAYVLGVAVVVALWGLAQAEELIRRALQGAARESNP